MTEYLGEGAENEKDVTGGSNPTTSAEESGPGLAPELNSAQGLAEENEQKGPAFYVPSTQGGPFRQSEILSNVLQYCIAVESLGDEEGLDLVPVLHGLAIIVSQDCDLEQDFKQRQRVTEAGETVDREDDKLLPCVLLCEVATAKAILESIGNQGRTIREKFRKNHEDRYQYLREVEPTQDAEGCGIDAMGIDFKRYFTVPTQELYEQLKQGCQRRCRLGPQYLEHLSDRFTNHLSRVGLPRNHHD